MIRRKGQANSMVGKININFSNKFKTTTATLHKHNLTPLKN